MKLYLLNALITPYQSSDQSTAAFLCRTINQSEYINIFRQAVQDNRQIVSSLGHQSTIDYLKTIFPEDIRHWFTKNREPIFFEEGDLGLAFRITDRGAQMTEWTLDDIQTFYQQGKTEFVLISRIFAPELVLDPANYFSAEEV